MTEQAANSAELNIGDVAADGSVYVGISAVTQKPLYAAAEDEMKFLSWRKAKKAAKHKDAHGHTDWRLPTPGELEGMIEHRKEGALTNTFNSLGSAKEAFYWSSRPKALRYAKAVCSYKGIFTHPVSIRKRGKLSVRCVRNG